jgi:hypothetical protein
MMIIIFTGGSPSRGTQLLSSAHFAALERCLHTRSLLCNVCSTFMVKA